MGSKTASPSAAQQKSGGVRQKSFLLWVAGITIVFQLTSHLKMWRALHEEEDSSENECSAFAAPSPRCAEVQLFRSWQRATAAAAAASASRGALDVEDMTSMAPYDNSAMLLQAVFATTTPSPQLAATLSTSPPTSPPAESAATGPSDAVATVAPSSDDTDGEKAWAPLTAWAQGLIDLQQSLEEKLQGRRRRSSEPSSEFERHAARITKSLEGTSLTPWGQGLQQLQKDMETRKAALPSQRRLQNENKEPSLMDQINAAHRELCEAPERRDRQECVDFLAHLAASSEASADASRLVKHATAGAVQRAIAAGGSSMDELREHTKVLEAELAKIADDRHSWQRQFDEKVRATYSEFCASRGGIWCTTPAPVAVATAEGAEVHDSWQRQFDAKVSELYHDMCETHGGAWCTTLAPRPSAAERHAAHEELRSSIKQEAKERSAALDAKLAQLATDRRVWERELLEHYGLASNISTPDEASAKTAANATEEAAADELSSSTLVQLWADVPNLYWSTVVAWKDSNAQKRQQKLRGSSAGGASSGREHLNMTRAELMSARWVGMLPKVAAVAAIPLGHGAKSQVKYVIESFNKQTYEGPKQLVLVFHHEDEEAAEVVKMYADGMYIKAVAAHGPREEYPSATALRFGAWSSDADAIAQWDFDEWQHPERLALQVRALALAMRPACLLRKPPSATPLDHDEGSKLWEGSLVGEATWMREHWHPSIKEQREVFEGAQAGNIVMLDMGLPSHPSAHSPAGLAAAERLDAIRTSIDKSFEQLLKLFEAPAPNSAETSEVENGLEEVKERQPQEPSPVATQKVESVEA